MSYTRRISSRTLLRGGVAAGVAAAATMAAVAPAGAATAATAARHSCVALDGLTSVQTSYVTKGGPGIGESATFVDNILDAGGNVIGTRQGSAYIAYADPTTGDLMAIYQATFTFAAGDVDSTGVIDTKDAVSGVPTTITGVGLSGAYRGKTGTVTNQKVTDTTDTVDIDLCG